MWLVISVKLIMIQFAINDNKNISLLKKDNQDIEDATSSWTISNIGNCHIYSYWQVQYRCKDDQLDHLIYTTFGP